LTHCDCCCVTARHTCGVDDKSLQVDGRPGTNTIASSVKAAETYVKA
jgi:hypothetical protein